ncbi:MAG: hypothetical protein J6Y29_01920 [Clostridiales bacterium]|nr:hypothetical protein [Clostridiales bacterium]
MFLEKKISEICGNDLMDISVGNMPGSLYAEEFDYMMPVFGAVILKNIDMSNIGNKILGK